MTVAVVRNPKPMSRTGAAVETAAEKLTMFALMLGVAHTHVLAPGLTSRPVLVEIGASCPAPSLFLLDSVYETSPELEKWPGVARRLVPWCRRDHAR